MEHCCSAIFLTSENSLFTTVTRLGARTDHPNYMLCMV